MVGLDEWRELIKGSRLDGRETVELTVPTSRVDRATPSAADMNSVLAVRVDASEVMEAWQVARGLVGRTGRWPVVVCSFDFQLDSSSALTEVAETLDRTEYEWELAGPSAPIAIVERSQGVDAETELERLAGEATWLEKPDPAAVPDAVPPYNDWYEPRNQLVALLLLPDSSPENALAYVHWYAGRQELPSHALISILRRWRARFGAELVAHWGTMLQLVVDEPPTSTESALALAREQELVAPCTTAMPGASTEEHAALLMGSERWFLHERP
jgi:hypothetical protein